MAIIEPPEKKCPRQGHWERIKLPVLAALMALYSITPVLGKLASAHALFSLPFMGYFLAELAVLGIYALLWQQVLRRTELSVAYSARSLTLFWGLVWGMVFFNEAIDLRQLGAVALVAVGVYLIGSGKEAA